MKNGVRDDFENKYMGKFRALAAPHGLFVEYERDRAGRDIGLQLTRTNQAGDGKIVTPALIWFQMKGIMAGTLALADYQKSEEVVLDLEVAHLRFWYLNIQPTYLAVYVESADQFLAIDLQKWVERHTENGARKSRQEECSRRPFLPNCVGPQPDPRSQEHIASGGR
ncbi:DUF4365 domain-containing protein [Ensifer sp. ENS11]|uniref:DUF4365 domain-containing protein n=1 Tax=Ensifer sp. ENS11 TaxID=2769291 RepID=UPI00177F9A07|nr:DUF4365 domain-containing protein [Ensifer sp. ENS11]MBD9490484.1 DUF4365 domain-containing protein [Ensifer sp. ENS11]MDP9633019.1 hypothetical protein [Ensifer adhaerens]